MPSTEDYPADEKDEDDGPVLIPQSGYAQSVPTVRVNSQLLLEKRTERFHRTHFLRSSYTGERFVLPKAWIVPSTAVIVKTSPPESMQQAVAESKDQMASDGEGKQAIDDFEETQENQHGEINVNLAYGEEIFSLPDPYPIDKDKHKDSKDGKGHDVDGKGGLESKSMLEKGSEYSPEAKGAARRIGFDVK